MSATPSSSPPSSSSSPPSSSSSTSSNATAVQPTFINEKNLGALLTWADSDDEKKKLIQKRHIDGRIDQAINFSNFLETFDQNDDAKLRYVSRERFYTTLQAKYTKKRAGESSGFSSSSCKRLKREGDCYITLLKAGRAKFPQDQKVALFLNRYEAQDIPGIWDFALALYDGDETCVKHNDILDAADKYRESVQNRPQQSEEMAVLTQQLKDIQIRLETQGTDFQTQLEAANARANAQLETQAKDFQTQMEAVNARLAAETRAVQRLQNTNPVDVVEVTVEKLELMEKKLEASEKCITDIEKELFFAFRRPINHALWEKITNYEDLRRSFSPPRFEVRCDPVGKVSNLSEWTDSAHLHFQVVFKNISKCIKLKEREFVDLEDAANDSGDDGNNRDG